MKRTSEEKALSVSAQVTIFARRFYGMPELLTTIEKKGKREKPRRTLIYGTHGIGKSTFASCMPAPIIFDLEDGLDDIECDATPRLESLDDVLAWIGELYEGQHKFETICIDTLDFLERLIWKSVCAKGGKTVIDDFGFGRGYKAALQVWVELLEGFDALRETRKMSILLLAHSETSKYENPETEPYDRYGPRLHKGASQLIQQWCDEVLFATHRIYTVKDEAGGFNKERHRGLGGEERVIRTVERASHLAKNRLGMPSEIPLAWKEYAKYVKTTKAPKKPSVTVKEKKVG